MVGGDVLAAFAARALLGRLPAAADSSLQDAGVLSSADSVQPPQASVSSSLDSWSFGPTWQLPAGSIATPGGQGRLLLVLGTRGASKAALMCDAPAALSDGWGCRVAVVSALPGGNPAIGAALQLSADVGSAAAQAAAVGAAWRTHEAQVVLTAEVLQGAEVVAAVAAALEAGCSVIAAAGADSLAALHQLATDKGSSAEQAAAVKLWQLLSECSSTSSIVECLPGSSGCARADCQACQGLGWRSR
jgi:hypothetical protein